MTSHEVVASGDEPRRSAGRSSRKTANLPPLVAAIAAGAFAVTDEQFEAALDDLRRELAPTTVLESLFVALIVEAAERLRRASEKRDEIDAGDKTWTRYRNSAERSFWKALNSLMRGRRPARAARPADSPRPEIVATIAGPEAVAPPATAARLELSPVAREAAEGRSVREPKPAPKAPILVGRESALIASPADFSFVDLFATPPTPIEPSRRHRPPLLRRRA